MLEHPTSRTTRYVPPAEPQRLQGDDGVTAFVAALCMVALLIFAALATDLGLAYAGGRAMQNAGDAAAMRGTAKLLEYKKNPAIGLASVQAAANTGVVDNNGTMDSCEIIQNDGPTYPSLGLCGSGAENHALASGVRVKSHGTTPTAFGGVLGYTQLNETRMAAATAQPLLQGAGPFFVCGGGQLNENQDGDFNWNPPDATHPSPWPKPDEAPLLPLLEYFAGSPATWQDMPAPTTANGLVNSNMTALAAQWPGSKFRPNAEAIGTVYYIHTPQSNSDTFADCEDGSAGWHGVGQENNTDPPIQLPTVLDPGNGVQAGPTRTNVAAQPNCGVPYQNGCVLVLPLCPGSNGMTGNNYQMYCVKWGAFKIHWSSNSDNKHYAQFLGGAVVTGGQGGEGPADPNSATVLKLVQ